MSFKRNIQYLMRNLSKKHNRALDEARNSLSVTMPTHAGIACLNFMIDFELIWGNGNLGGIDHSIERRIQNAEKQCQNFKPFLKLLNELNFLSSWAILGKLVNNNCEISEEQRFNPSWARASNWYLLPDGLEIRKEFSDGTDYLEAIKHLTAPKEILSHGYAHIDYSDMSVTMDIAKKDLKLSVELLKNYTHEAITSFVFPCNKHRFIELLKAEGINVIRGQSHQWTIEKDLIQTPLGFWISPGAMSFKELLPSLEKAITNKCWIHPWMHLIECDLKENDLEDFYRPFFEWCLEKEAIGKLKIVKYSDIRTLL